MLDRTDKQKKKTGRPRIEWGPHLWAKTERMIAKAKAEGSHSDKPHTEACSSCGREAQPYEGVIGTRKSICKACWKARQIKAEQLTALLKKAREQ